ncbi:MAG: PilZ domain-containing protein [Desulfobulbaceae bacterium]|nr:PilZ domain-containing protein [Desulfobulbaceae bacterium]MCK5339509.1 PilZ domain-containing protein [Desulfobulbaceae bacterium]MCK5404699.1 PilZ domain-containing protein [Desulfobulbaceae bacterium]
MNANGMKLHTSERRNHIRYQTQERAMAASGPNFQELPYHIVDISMGGLAFHYVSEKTLANKLELLNIYFDDELYIDDVSIKSVADHKMDNGSVPTRRHCVSFGKLKPTQATRLEYYIRNFSGETKS